MRSAVQAVADGRPAVLSGPAGIGKSWALGEVEAILASAGRGVLRVTATRSIAGVPFGALLPVLPASVLRTDPGPGWLTATADVVRRAVLANPDAVLVVDDAHCLDGPSAGVVFQLTEAGASVVLAVRTDEDLPDGVSAILRSDRTVLNDVTPLDAREATLLLSHELGGEVDERLVTELRARTGGVPLALQIHVRAARRSAVVGVVAARWVLQGELQPQTELLSLVAGALDSLTPEGRRAAELVALADHLPVVRLATIPDAVGAAEAERAQILAVDADGTIRVAHPLIRDALLAGLTELDRRSMIAGLVESEHDPSGAAAVRHAAWRLELGLPVGVDRLLRLAAATAAGDQRAAERFARAAVDAGGGDVAAVALAELLAHQHRAQEAIEVLDRVDVSALPPQSALGATLTRAYLLVFVLARPDDGLALVDGLPDPVRSIPMVQALRSSALLWSGRYAASLPIAAAVAADEDAPIDARAHAALTWASDLMGLGRLEDLAGRMPEFERSVAAARFAIPEGAEALRLVEGLAGLQVGLDVRGAARAARAGVRRALDRGDDGERAQWEQIAGQTALLAGDAAAGLVHLRRAIGWGGRWAANDVFIRAIHVQALVLTGDATAAEEECAALQDESHPMYGPYRFAAAAAVAAVRLDFSGARTLARAMATADTEDAAIRAVGWYDAMRYGSDPAAARFLVVASALPGPGREAQRDHARAVRAQDPAALRRAALRLQEAGLGWFAVDAAAMAVRLTERQDPLDLRSRSVLDELLGAHPTLQSPIVAALARSALTTREAQIAHRIAAGEPAREVAVRLGIGVRTVETHVASVYRKLGVNTRQQLRSLLLDER